MKDTKMCLTSEQMDQELCVKCVGSRKDLKDINHPRLTLYINVDIDIKIKKYFFWKRKFFAPFDLYICEYSLETPQKKTILTH
jgi:hypothetical protein